MTFRVILSPSGEKSRSPHVIVLRAEMLSEAKHDTRRWRWCGASGILKAAEWPTR
jgi:hypothetical protein